MLLLDDPSSRASARVSAWVKRGRPEPNAQRSKVEQLASRSATRSVVLTPYTTPYSVCEKCNKQPCAKTTLREQGEGSHPLLAAVICTPRLGLLLDALVRQDPSFLSCSFAKIEISPTRAPNRQSCWIAGTYVRRASVFDEGPRMACRNRLLA